MDPNSQCLLIDDLLALEDAENSWLILLINELASNIVRDERTLAYRGVANKHNLESMRVFRTGLRPWWA